MKAHKNSNLLNYLTRGMVYRRNELAFHSNAVDRELKMLESSGQLKRVGPGLYYYPKETRFGVLPPDEQKLLSKFLKSHNFLLLSPNWYNALGLGLTQLSAATKVYNTKRYDTLILADQKYSFIRPNNGFPKKVTREFLLIDLMNNLNTVGEDEKKLQSLVTKKIDEFNKKLLFSLAEKYGKVSTKKFFIRILNNDVYSSIARC